jgi:hypothetical protein
MNFIFENMLFILAGLMFLGFGISGWFLFVLAKKIKILFGGQISQDEAGFQKDLIRRLSKAEAKLEEFEPRIDLLEEISKISVQKVGFLRFNPFQDIGGDASFVLVMLNRQNDGVIITSLYMREGIRIYAKKVEAGKTKQRLSQEEEKVLQETLNQKVEIPSHGKRLA